MKLIRCHIQNFGILHEYDVEFAPDVTVVNEPNGAGKTTLAAFIQSMFYGFPRATEDLSKNPRKKYLPWQGGCFGGSLEFEHDGRQYLITREFGKSARDDTFSLQEVVDGETVPSQAFSRDLGLEIFGIDADSFNRSTFLAQNYDSLESLSTADIQAKLASLVQNTGSVNGFENALALLAAADRDLDYDDGTANAASLAHKALTSARDDLARTQEACDVLSALESDRQGLLEQRRDAEASLSSLRMRHDQATWAIARNVLDRSLADLNRRHDLTSSCIASLDASYPKGYPSVADIQAAADALTAVNAAQDESYLGDAYAEAAQTYADGAMRFSLGTPSDAQIDSYRSRLMHLFELSGQAKSSTLDKDESDELAALQERFAAGVPTEDFLRAAADECRIVRDLKSELARASLSDDQQGELAQIRGILGADAPDTDTLAECSVWARELDLALSQKDSARLSDDKLARIAELESLFSEGVPLTNEIAAIKGKAAEAEAIRASLQGQEEALESSRKALADADEAEKLYTFARKPGTLGVTVTVLGFIGLAVGAALYFYFALKEPAYVVAGAGLLLFIVGLVLNSRSSKAVAAQKERLRDASAQAKQQTDAASATVEAQQSGLASLDQEVASFTSRFAVDAGSDAAESPIEDIALATAELESLRGELAAVTSRSDILGSTVSQLTQKLDAVLTPYAAEGEGYAQTARRLLGYRTRLDDLSAKSEASLAACREIGDQIMEIEGGLTSALEPYGAQPTESSVSELADARKSFIALDWKRSSFQEKAASYSALSDDLYQDISSFLGSYGIETQNADQFAQALDSLKADVLDYTRAKYLVEQAGALEADRQKALEPSRLLLLSFCDRYGFDRASLTMGQIQTIRDDIRDRESLVARLAEEASQIEDFVQEHSGDLARDVPASYEDPDDLAARILAAQEKLDATDALIADNLVSIKDQQVLADRLPETLDAYDRSVAAQDAIAADRKTLGLVAETLSKAKDNLTYSYLDDIKGKLANYLDAFVSGNAVTAVDENLGVKLGVDGQKHDLGYYSMGYIDIVSVCMRMALVDTLFKDTKPFVVMDDPFVNLDDDKTREALALLAKLAESYQIVYLTCHSSRTPQILQESAREPAVEG